MVEKIRSFVAIELPDSAKRELGKIIDALYAADIRGIRPVRSNGVHLTLKFLGDIDADRVDAISEALSHAASPHSPFGLKLGEAGAFPNLGKPRVLWVGVQGDLEALARLQTDVEGALATVGFAKDNRGYNPHLTLARVRNESPPSSSKRATDVMAKTPIQEAVAFPVKHISLMRTTLHPDGAIHQRLVSIALEGGYPSLI